MSKGIMSPPANVRPPYLQTSASSSISTRKFPPDLTFADDTGRAVKLGDYFGKKPLILNLVYYNCTMLCGEALAGLTRRHEDDQVRRRQRIRCRHRQLQSEGNAGHRRRKKAGLPQALRPRRRRVGLAFPDRPCGFDQRAHQGRRLSISVRRQTQPIRARHRDHGADSPGPYLALLLRCGFSAERSAHGTGRGLARKRSATPSIRFCSTAITTIPRPENMARSSATC